jgi:hypothetical protein
MWERHIHEKRSVPYYHNKETKVSQYSLPTSCAWVKGFLDGSLLYTNSITHQSKWTMPKALAWKHLHSVESNTCVALLL